jgi:lipoteichoic acid synthase
MLDLDLQGLIDRSSDETVVNVTKYLTTLTPSKTNEMTGLFKGKNLILITAEAFSLEFISEELTPTLYRMMTEGIWFKDYYQPAWGGSTSSGEFSVMTGIDPARGVNSIKNTIGKNMDVTIGNLLRKQGYFTRAYHNHSYDYYSRNLTHENLGYEKFIGLGNGMENGVDKVWPESDLQMFEYTVPQYIDQQPFSVYYMTVSGHGAYSWLGNRQSGRHKDEVQDLPYSETVRAYIACNLEVEYAMRYLLEQLEAAGIADDTVVVLTADHYPYCLTKSDAWYTDKDYLSEYFGYEVKDCFGQDHNCLIMWSGCLEDKNIRVDDPTFSLDIVPTLCNLFGVEFDSRLYSGRDVFSDAEPLVFWPNHSWKTDKGQWDASKSDGSEFTAAEGAEVTEEYINNIRKTVSNKISYSYRVLDPSLDYFKLLLE